MLSPSRRCLILAAALLAACERGDLAPRLSFSAVSPATAARGQPVPMADVPTAVVGGERRPVLYTVAPETIALTTYPVGAPETLRMAIDVPPSLQGRKLRLSGRWMRTKSGAPGTAIVVNLSTERREALRAALETASGTSSHLEVRPAAIDADAAPDAVEVDVPPAARRDELMVEVLARPLPDAEHVSRPFEVPRRGRLEVGIALADRGAATAPATFAIAVREGGRSHEVFREAIDPAAGDRWHDRAIDLAPWAGRTVELVFATPDVDRGDGGALALWSDPVVVGDVGGAGRSPNLLLVSLDTLRGDHVGTYGYARPTTPTLDALGAGGVVFERAFAPAPHTGPSHATMLTGVDPCVHGVEDPRYDTARQIAPPAVNLAEILRAAGYRTAAFTEDGFVTAQVGFARGFEVFVEESGARLNEGRVEETFAAGLDWIRRHRGSAPWFVFLHTYQVHEPYTPPPGYLEQVAWDAKPGLAEQRRALYDGEIRYTDDVLAHLLAGLEDAGVARDTVLIVTSDHGEQFGEHGLFRHDNSVYDAVLNVPLVVRAPGLLPAGKRVSDAVGLIDVVPTALSLLGVAAPAWLQGRDLTAAVRGEPSSARPLYATHVHTGQIAVRSGDRKLVVDRLQRRRAAYEWLRDPAESRDIAGAVPDDVWEAFDRDYRAHCERGLALLTARGSSGRGSGGGGSGDGAGRAVRLDADTQERLRQLGYAQ